MTTLAVIKNLYTFLDDSLGLESRGESTMVDQLVFQTTPKTFDRRVIEAQLPMRQRTPSGE